jgi:hypothetical protein
MEQGVALLHKRMEYNEHDEENEASGGGGESVADAEEENL